jgi:hypothetical protein
MITSRVYLNHSNTIDIVLTANGAPVDLTGVTQITLVVGDTTISSTNQSTDVIRWSQSGWVTGKVVLTLGGQSIEEGTYPRCYLTVYDATWTSGLVWDVLQLEFVDID